MFTIKKMSYTAILIAIGILLPMAFHSIPNAGLRFLPMHIPVLLCGLVCGLPYGLICGIITPVLSYFFTGMPPAAMMPSMLTQLTVYGAVSAALMHAVRFKNMYANLYISLIGAMLAGRIVFGILNALVFTPGTYSVKAWIGAMFITAVPGIIIQIIAIPIVFFALKKARLI